MTLRLSSLALFAALAPACGSTPSPSTDAGPDDAGPVGDATGIEDARADDAGAPLDAGPPVLRACPIAMPDGCFVLTPEESGLPAGGVNATVDQYALRPTTAPARGTLLLFLNGSGGSPRGAASAGAVNWYTVARDEGLHALGVSYASDEAVGRLCAGLARNACFVPTRETILRGAFQPGAASELSTITEDEGVYARLEAALATLAAGDPAGGWEAFLRPAGASPEDRIRWDRVMVSGHSQGGGHAALVGRDHAVARVIMLASPCDGDGTAPASWLSSPDGYVTSPATSFVGLGAAGDEICGTFEAAWIALGMPEGARHVDAVVCAGESAHGAPLGCADNAARWAALLR
jgi:hypothetical protein